MRTTKENRERARNINNVLGIENTRANVKRMAVVVQMLNNKGVERSKDVYRNLKAWVDENPDKVTRRVAKSGKPMLKVEGSKEITDVCLDCYVINPQTMEIVQLGAAAKEYK